MLCSIVALKRFPRVVILKYTTCSFLCIVFLRVLAILFELKSLQKYIEFLIVQRQVSSISDRWIGQAKFALQRTTNGDQITSCSSLDGFTCKVCGILHTRDTHLHTVLRASCVCVCIFVPHNKWRGFNPQRRNQMGFIFITGIYGIIQHQKHMSHEM